MEEKRNTENSAGNAKEPEDAASASSHATELERKQWHGPYFGSMRLELRSNKEGYVYAGEYSLNVKSLLIDMLARANREVAWVLDEITTNFRKHNIIEFKSPDDDLNLDVFYKTIGYACLYKAQESRMGEIPETRLRLRLSGKESRKSCYRSWRNGIMWNSVRRESTGWKRTSRCFRCRFWFCGKWSGVSISG